MKEMIVTINVDGEIKIETSGYTGKTCVSDSQFLKDLLGEEISRELKPTYYEREGNKCTKHLPLCG